MFVIIILHLIPFFLWITILNLAILNNHLSIVVMHFIPILLLYVFDYSLVSFLLFTYQLVQDFVHVLGSLECAAVPNKVHLHRYLVLINLCCACPANTKRGHVKTFSRFQGRTLFSSLEYLEKVKIIIWAGVCSFLGW